MPYSILPFDNGYKVCKKYDHSKCFSHHPIPLNNARRQLRAIGMTSHLSGGSINLESAKRFIAVLKKVIGGLHVVGSVARRVKIVGDIDIVTLNNLEYVKSKLSEICPNIEILKDGKKHLSIYCHNANVQVDIWKADNKDDLKYMKIIRSIDKGHNIAYKKIARSNNMKLNNKGLFYDDHRIDFNNEKELRNILRL